MSTEDFAEGMESCWILAAVDTELCFAEARGELCRLYPTPRPQESDMTILRAR
jgi:hypothetical protein